MKLRRIDHFAHKKCPRRAPENARGCSASVPSLLAVSTLWDRAHHGEQSTTARRFLSRRIRRSDTIVKAVCVFRASSGSASATGNIARHSVEIRSVRLTYDSVKSIVVSQSGTCVCLVHVGVRSCELCTGARPLGRTELKGEIRARPSSRAKRLKYQTQNLSAPSRASTDSESISAIWPAWPFQPRRMPTSRSSRVSMRARRGAGLPMTLSHQQMCSASCSPRS